MAITDGDGSTTGSDTPDTDDGLLAVLDEESRLELTDRGPRRGRWPANDYY